MAVDGEGGGGGTASATREILRSHLKSARIYLLSFPAGTRVILTVCIVLQIVAAATGPTVTAALCMSPAKIYSGGIHRLVTHSVVHSGWLHLAVNMLSLLPLGPALEEKIGTLPFLVLQLHAAFLGSIAYLILTYIVGAPRYEHVCVLGYSGVLLTMLVIFVYKFTTTETIKVFGLVQVPNTLAPWACLIAFQLIPHVSFFGHLAGILVGYGMYGGGMRILLPTEGTLDYLAARGPCGGVTRLPGFVKAPAGGGLPVTITNGAAAAGSGSTSPGGRFPGVGRQLVPTAERGASLYEEPPDPAEGDASPV